MLRRSSCRLAVNPYMRFLIDGKGTLSGMPIAKRAMICVAEYAALKKDPSKFAALVKRAAATPRPQKRVPVPRKANTYALFTKSVFAAKLIPAGTKFTTRGKQLAALWKKYKAAVEAKQGKPVAKNTKVFDVKLLRSLA